MAGTPRSSPRAIRSYGVFLGTVEPNKASEGQENVVDFKNIWAVARMERRHTRRLVRYWVFLSIAYLFGIGGYVYYSVLLSHVLLAFAVPFLAIAAAILGVRALGWGRAAALPVEARDRSRRAHIRIVRWAFPIWLYVSVTGVVVYAMLYHLWPSADIYPKLNAAIP